MRLLHFSDLHLDSHFRWAGPDVGRERRSDLRRTLKSICDLAQEESVDALLCAGDLYEDARFTPDTVKFVAETFGKLDIPVLLAPGNHDWLGPTSLYATADWTPNVHVFESTYLTAYELTDGFTIWGAAHRAPANTNGFLEDFTVNRGGINIALFHGSEQGTLQWQDNGKVPHAPFREDQIHAAGLNHAFVGHFHTPRSAVWYTYPGNPEPLTFGEVGLRGAVIADFDERGGMTRTTHVVAVGQMTDIEVALSDITHSGQVVDQVRAAVEPLTGIVRVTLTGEIGEDVDIRIEDLQPAGAHLDALIARVGEVSIAYDIDDLANEQTVRGEFVRAVREDQTLTDEERRRVIVTGLRALSGRKDLEVQ